MASTTILHRLFGVDCFVSADHCVRKKALGGKFSLEHFYLSSAIRITEEFCVKSSVLHIFVAAVGELGRLHFSLSSSEQVPLLNLNTRQEEMARQPRLFKKKKSFRLRESPLERRHYGESRFLDFSFSTHKAKER